MSMRFRRVENATLDRILWKRKGDALRRVAFFCSHLSDAGSGIGTGIFMRRQGRGARTVMIRRTALYRPERWPRGRHILCLPPWGGFIHRKEHSMLTKVLLSTLLLTSIGVAHAAQQTPAPAQQPAATANTLTPEQQAQLARQNQEMIHAATVVAQMIDQNKAGNMWDIASSVAKGVTTREAFVQQITTERKALGTVTSRNVQGLTRSQSDGKKTLPAGLYINVRFSTQFTQAKQPVGELISFHLDSDKVWRLAGYSLH
jgi:hypothetical protein